MAILIDADKLLEEIERIYSDHYEKAYDKSIHDVFNAVRRRIRRGRNVDAVEVVRCNDCKFWCKGYFGNNCCMLHKGLVLTHHNTFCSYGERKDND